MCVFLYSLGPWSRHLRFDLPRFCFPSTVICNNFLVASYLSRLCTLTKQAQNKLVASHTKLERSMLNITYKDRKTNIWVRERRKVNTEKNEMAGHINSLKDDRWTSRVTTWRPYDKKRKQMETSQALERRPGQLLQHDMTEDSIRQANLETSC